MGGCFMFYGHAYAFSTLAVVTLLVLSADGQSVISTHSGVVHFFEGSVYLGDQLLEPRLGRFPNIAEGAELRTEQGHAEVLLTPGVFLRVGDNSAVRMIANVLSDTRVGLMSGSVLLESAEPGSGTSVTLVFKTWNVHFREKGIYRIDAEPPRLWVHQGGADVFADGAGTPVSVEQGMYLPFASVLVPERFIDVPGDALADWAKGRSESISADDAITAQIDEDPASRNSDLGIGGFAYFPLIGAPSIGSGLSAAYGGFNSYQPGFNSIYLPGYTYRPLILGPALVGIRSYQYSPPRHVGVSPTVPRPYGPIPLPRPTPGRPVPHGRSARRSSSLVIEVERSIRAASAL